MLAIYVYGDFVGSRSIEPGLDDVDLIMFLTKTFGDEPEQILIIQNDQVVKHYDFGDIDSIMGRV